MSDGSSVFLGKGETAQNLSLRYANRHGLIAGATGTGKTITLQILAQGLSEQGVPVFLADVKGDLSGISQAAKPNAKILKRCEKIGLADYAPAAAPTVFWDLFGEQGHPLRTTISEMGPLLLARLLQLNDTQEGVLSIAFEIADDEGLLLLDLKDLRSMLSFLAENAREISGEYGNVSKASVGAIQRRLLTLEQQGGGAFFGEPAFDLHDFLRCGRNGQGFVNVLAADQLMLSPRLYATFLLWLLSELFEELPEVGDQERPKLVFFFDEAHLLFDDAPKALVDKVEQVVRLIRSKGVGVFFVTQNPLDLPDEILGQLGNRVQHALRAFTPRDRKAVKAAAETFRQNPALDTAEVITELGVGEALVSTLQEGGIPSMVDRTLIRPPASRMGPANKKERKAIQAESPFAGRYDRALDRESAHEILQRRAEKAAEEAERADKEAARAKKKEREAREARRSRPRSRRSSSRRQSAGEAMVKSVLRSVGTQLGRQIARGILGSLFKGR